MSARFMKVLIIAMLLKNVRNNSFLYKKNIPLQRFFWRL